MTREVCDKCMKEECNRVKELKGKCLPWYVDPRPKDEVWMTDDVRKMKGAGGVKGDKLVAAGILTVADMKSKSDTELLTLSKELEGVSHKKLVEWRDFASHPGSCPHKIIDHRKALSTYYSRHRSFWEEGIKKTTFMK